MWFAVRVNPDATRDAVGGTGDGTGAACRVLAPVWGARARDLGVVKRNRSRDKIVEMRDGVPGAADRPAGSQRPGSR